MRYRDIHIVGLGTQLGDLVPSQVAIADGRFAIADAMNIGQKSVSCSDRRSGELAVAAGRLALSAARARTPDGPDVASRLALHLHASVCCSGIEVWSQSCHILNSLADPGPMISVQLNAVSNGCLAAIELAAQVLSAGDPAGADYALVTSADSFTEPDFPRWSTERGLVFGDGAGAAVLGRFARDSGRGIATLLSTASYTDACMEGLHRGDEEIIGGGRPHTTPINLRARSRVYLEKVGGPEFVSSRHAKAVTNVIGRVLDETGATMKDVARVVLPFFGREFIEREYLELLGIQEEDTVLTLGLTVGHLGGSDQIVGLDHLISSGLVRAGDLVLLIGIGAGFTWTAAIVQIV